MMGIKGKKKSSEEIRKIQQIYNQMGACVNLDEYGEIRNVAYGE